MRALKLLVIGMAVVIVVATAALVTIIVQRAGTLRAPAAAADRPIAVPLGFRVTATELSGDRLLVRLEGREPGSATDEIRLLTIDLDRGNAPRIVRLIVPPAEQGR